MIKLRWIFLAVNLVLVVGLFFLGRERGFYFWKVSDTAVQTYGAVPDFLLTERDGSQVSLSSLKNKVWIADFIFARCAGQCPLMSQKMSALQDKIKNAYFVSFTVDPENDTPAILSDYAKIYHADPSCWFFLTGDKETLNRVAQGFHVTGLDEPMFHSAKFILVDKKGQIRGYYDTDDSESLKRLKADAHELVNR